MVQQIDVIGRIEREQKVDVPGSRLRVVRANILYNSSTTEIQPYEFVHMLLNRLFLQIISLLLFSENIPRHQHYRA